jgi:hypothetical protein
MNLRIPDVYIRTSASHQWNRNHTHLPQCVLQIPCQWRHQSRTLHQSTNPVGLCMYQIGISMTNAHQWIHFKYYLLFMLRSVPVSWRLHHSYLFFAIEWTGKKHNIYELFTTMQGIIHILSVKSDHFQLRIYVYRNYIAKVGD